MNSKDLKEQIKQDLLCNVRRGALGKRSYTLEILGLHGIGKSEIAFEAGMEAMGLTPDQTIKISAAQLEDVSDLVGLPTKQFIFAKGEERVTIPSELVSLYIERGYVYQDMHVTTTLPDWAKRVKENKAVVVIDDYTRANPIIIQALMTFLLDRKLGEWELPKGVTVILTSNPADSEEAYMVTATDGAQKDRMITYNYEFNHANWVEWARSKNYPAIAVDFMAENPIYFDEISPRRWTLFMEALDEVTIKDKKFIQNHLMAIKPEIANAFLAYMEDDGKRVITPEKFKVLDMDTLKDIFQSYENAVEKQGAFTSNFVLYLKDNPKDLKYMCDKLFKSTLINPELKYGLFRSLLETFPDRKGELMDYTYFLTNNLTND